MSTEATERLPLLGLSLQELRDVVTSLGMPAYTGGQVAKWLYERRVRSMAAWHLPTVSTPLTAQ